MSMYQKINEAKEVEEEQELGLDKEDAEGEETTSISASAPPLDEKVELEGSKARQKKAPEIPQLDRRNWLLHYHFVRKEIDACKALIKEQLDETASNCEYALYIKALILRQEGKIQESLDVLQQCAMLNPQSADYVKQIARSLFLLGKQKNALDVFDEALKLNSEDWAKDCLKKSAKLSRHEKTLTLLGKILAEEGELMNAIEAYKGALELVPENPDLLTTLGLLYLKTGSFQQAFEALGRGLSFDPSHPGAILAAGSMMQQHGDYEVALSKYKVAATLIPDSAQLWSNIAMAFYAKKKFVAVKVALSKYKVAATLIPGSAQLWSNIAMAFYAKKKFVAVKAISCLKRANYLAPLDWKILYNLGVVHYGMQQYASAFHFLSAAINLNPKVPVLFMTLAVVLTNLEDYKNARQAYEHAASLDERDPTIALNYAIFLLKQRDRKKAQEWFQNYESRLPNVRDPKSGQLRCEPEVLDMAEKFRHMLRTGLDPNEDSERKSRGRTADASEESKPDYLNRYPFENEPVSVPPASGAAAAEEGRVSPTPTEKDRLTIQRRQIHRAETDSIRSISSRFHNDESAI